MRLRASARRVGVAVEHLEVGEHVVGERHGLRALEVRVAGEEGVLLALGEREQRALKGTEQRRRAVDGVADVEAGGGRDLVVAGARGVEPPRQARR